MAAKKRRSMSPSVRAKLDARKKAPAKKVAARVVPERKPPRQFTAWSFSRWNDWMQCPYRAKLKYLDKLVTPEMRKRDDDMRSGKVEPGPLQRGEQVAKEAEKFLKAKRGPVPMSLMPLAKNYRELRDHGNLSVEQSWGFTRDWKPCSPTDWDNCWLRVKIDVSYVDTEKVGRGEYIDTLHIKDNKTGKFNDRKAEEYEQQLELYGVAGLTLMPTVSRVTAQLLYSDIGVLHPAEPAVYTQDQLAALQATWNKRVTPMFRDVRFPPRPGYYCRWCDFSKAKGGPCRY